MLTIDPCNAHSLKDGHEKETHAAGCIVIKQLEDIHAPLQRERDKAVGNYYTRLMNLQHLIHRLRVN